MLVWCCVQSQTQGFANQLISAEDDDHVTWENKRLLSEARGWFSWRGLSGGQRFVLSSTMLPSTFKLKHFLCSNPLVCKFECTRHQSTELSCLYLCMCMYYVCVCNRYCAYCPYASLFWYFGLCLLSEGPNYYSWLYTYIFVSYR